MPERIAVKVLTGSDLTFFEVHFQRGEYGNQKSINLNSDVFAKLFYPDFAKRAYGKGIEAAVSVTLYGPRPGKPYRFPRSIGRQTESYKNWRLNGAAVPDPEGEPGRFDHLIPGDVAVMEFRGDAEPTALDFLVISSLDDPELHRYLADEVPGGRKSMAALTRRRLTEIARTAGIAADHPIHTLLDDPELDGILEEAQLGSEPAVRKLRERTARRLSKADLAAAKDRAERIGEDGEALASLLLDKEAADGRLPPVLWTSKEDAAAPWDFETNEWDAIRYDAKATTGAFERPFHMSAAEVAAAASPNWHYRIVRISELTEDGGVARISDDINGLAANICEAASHLPAGTLPTGFTIDPVSLTWGKAMKIGRPEDPEEEVTLRPA